MRNLYWLFIGLWLTTLGAPSISYSDGHSRSWDHQFILNWYHQWEFYRDGYERDNARADMERISLKSHDFLHKKCSYKLALFVNELKNLPENNTGMRDFYSRILDLYRYGMRSPTNWGPFYDIYLRCEAIMGSDWTGAFTTPIKQQVKSGPDARFPMPHFPYAGWRKTVFCGRKKGELGCAVP